VCLQLLLLVLLLLLLLQAAELLLLLLQLLLLLLQACWCCWCCWSIQASLAPDSAYNKWHKPEKYNKICLACWGQLSCLEPWGSATSQYASS
jgi:hypothetical protein